MTEMTEMTKISEIRIFFEKLTKKSVFLWCEENKWHKMGLPWMTLKKTLFLIIKKTALLWVTKIWPKLAIFMLRSIFGSKSVITLRQTKKDTTFSGQKNALLWVTKIFNFVTYMPIFGSKSCLLWIVCEKNAGDKNDKKRGVL